MKKSQIKPTISIINGPNLNLTGMREPDIYGKTGMQEYIQNLAKEFPEVILNYFQSNSEGKIIDKIQDCSKSVNAVIINPAGYTHTSVAIADAIAAVDIPFVEVHISNIFAREIFRQNSYTAPNCEAIISGMGLHGYRAALEYLCRKIIKNN